MHSTNILPSTPTDSTRVQKEKGEAHQIHSAHDPESGYAAVHNAEGLSLDGRLVCIPACNNGQELGEEDGDYSWELGVVDVASKEGQAPQGSLHCTKNGVQC
jgi:hypothetical protein